MRIAIYVRVSTLEQAMNGNSIDEQIERAKKYCEAMGWLVYKVYTDAGFSGANTDRPALQRMIKDIKTNKIDKVLVYKLDRLSRSQKDTLELIEDIFLANNTEFVSMNENFDTSTPFGRAMVGILAVFAQLEREQIKERMQMGKMARAKKGKFCGSTVIPIGYDLLDGDLQTNEFEKMQIIRIFEEYAAGKSTYAIARELNESGLFHKYGKWEHDTIYKLLQKKTYLGYNLYSGQWYKGIHEAYISNDLFNTVQNIIQRKKDEHENNNRRVGKANSYLGGYLECAYCHAKYSKVTKRYKHKTKTYVYEYYKCTSIHARHKELCKDPNCPNITWKMEELDNLVFNEIRKLSLDPNYIDEIKNNAPEDEKPKVIYKEIEKIESQINRYMDLYGVGNMPMDILQDKIHVLNEQKINLEHELIKIKRENESKLSKAETLQLVENFSDILDRADYDEIREVISSLIEIVEIKGKDITIHWNFV